MKKNSTLKLITYSLLGTIVSLNVNIDQASAQRLSARECQRSHEKIANYYVQRQPSLLNSNAYQQWANSMMNTIRQFEKKNPECLRVTTNDSRNNRVFYNNSMDSIREQAERDTEFRLRRMCMGRGGDWDTQRKKCYYD
ncbi:MAG: hypothetical protein AB4063_00210 [Crocosphaera sp.]